MQIFMMIITFITKSIKNGAKGIFAIITAILDYIVYAVFVKTFGFSILVSNILSWIIAESFAFISNKIFSYRGKGNKLLVKEYIKFFLSRIFVVILETTILKITIDFLGLEELKMKILAMIVTMITTWLANKYIVFRKSKYVSKIQLFKKIKEKIKKDS